MGLGIHFSHPWLLMLLIPAAAVILIPHFTLKKKYRRTRNRIVAMVLEGIVLTLAVFLLAGMTFVKTTSNSQNQIILLVDVSDTQERSAEDRDNFVAKVLDNAQNEGYQVGIVTFGFTQQYAVPVGQNGAYQKYLSSLSTNMPDTTATNIAAALNYTKDLFTSSSAKIVLITDGKETDENASTVIKAISAQGIKVDVAYIPSSFDEYEVQLTGVELPDYHVNLNEACSVSVLVQSGAAAPAVIELYDNGEIIPTGGEMTVDLTEGVQKITFTHSFTERGLHELTFNLTVVYENTDSLEGNNVYSTYLNLEVYDNILMINSVDEQSYRIGTILEGLGYKVTTVNVANKESLPKTIQELRQYDQVFLNNIAYSDFREDNPDYGLSPDQKQDIYPFVDLLYSFVYEYGGGLFTTGGSEGSNTAHAYNRQDLYGTTLQDLLPVQAVKYTPPLGLVIIIDRSGSMTQEVNGKSRLDWARSGAVTCLDQLTERDYMGLLTLDTDFSTILPMTPCTQNAKIRSAINSINEANGGTSYPGAIDRAGRMLRALENVDKRHIILITDGEVPSSDREAYETSIKNFYDIDGITFSVAGIGVSGSYVDIMKTAAELGHGRVHAVNDGDNFIKEMRDELNVEALKEVNFDEPFAPVVSNALSPVMKGVERGTEGETARRMTVKLGGFYGVKAKSDADVILATDYGAPIYAQWKFGKGMVGSFMCDVYSDWSGSFLNDKNGQQFISNLVFNLMPTENIRPSSIRVDINGENYLNQMSVITDLPSGAYIRGEIEYTEGGESHSISLNEVTSAIGNNPCYVTTPLSVSNNYTRCNFVIRSSGVYKITITKYDADGNTLDTFVTYKEFSYSKEYDISFTADELVMHDKLSSLASDGGGKLIADNEAPWEIFENFVAVFKNIYDPRLPFTIAIIVLFLLYVAVRKFKFKWIHEIIRDRKAKTGKKDK